MKRFRSLFEIAIISIAAVMTWEFAKKNDFDVEKMKQSCPCKKLKEIKDKISEKFTTEQENYEEYQENEYQETFFDYRNPEVTE